VVVAKTKKPAGKSKTTTAGGVMPTFFLYGFPHIVKGFIF
jgi:hypothetical protein